MTTMTIEEISNTLNIAPSRMQRAAINALENTTDNIILLSPTGTGKTLAYLLPLSQLIDTESSDVQAVVIVPGRELAEQSLQVLKSMKTRIRGYACHGGRPAMDEHREIRTVQPHVIFSTPGRLNDHLDKENFVVDNVKFVIIDEFDKCLEMGFADEMNRALGRMPKNARKFFLSATDADTADTNDAISTKGFAVIDYRDDKSENKVKVAVVHSPEKDKLATLAAMLKRLKGRSIVFVNYRESVERTADYLTEQGFIISSYHGGQEQREREEAIYKFANGSTNVLVSTNLGSRGLDIPDVENIIHYHLPETQQDYTHRIGRTARWKKKGNTFFILAPGEQLPEYVTSCDDEIADESALGEPTGKPAPKPEMVTIYIGRGKKNRISKTDVVGFLCKRGGLTGDEIGTIDIYERYTYVAVARSRMKDALKLSGSRIRSEKTKVELMA